MYIINNRTQHNHLDRIKSSYLGADEVMIVSPFLSDNINFFPFNELTHLKKIIVVTRLKPYTSDQFQKVEFLLQLYRFGKTNNIEIEVLVDNYLHGKVYVSMKDGYYKEAIITSANFNRHGLIVNNEWGIVLNDPNAIGLMVSEIRRHIFLKPLSMETLEQMKLLADEHPKKICEKEVKLDLSKLLHLLPNPLYIVTNATYWLKPIGVTGDPIRWGEPFDQKEYPLHFATRPTGVRHGDIMIAYAIEYGNILSIYEVISQVQMLSGEGHRWPYYLIGKNLTPHYGEQWSMHKLNINSERVKAIELGEFKVTPSGKDSFGRMNFGGDKMRLTAEFANHVIQKTMKINKEISEQPEV